MCIFFTGEKWHSSSLNYVKNHSWNSTQTVTKHHTNNMAWVGSWILQTVQIMTRKAFIPEPVSADSSSAHSGGKSIMHREIRFTPTSKKSAFVSRRCGQKCQALYRCTQGHQGARFLVPAPYLPSKGGPRHDGKYPSFFSISKDLWNQAEEA